MRDFSREALERPARTIEAARVLREQAEVLEWATLAARAGDIVVAGVRAGLSFAGPWTLAPGNLASQMSELEEAGGWSLTFAPGTPRTQIEARCDELADLARRRGDILQDRARRGSD